MAGAPAVPIQVEAARATPESKPSPLAPAQLVPSAARNGLIAGAHYLQVAAVEKKATELMVAKIRATGQRVTVAPGPTDEMIRLLAGPYKERAEYESAQRVLETAGYKPFLKRH